MINPIPQYTQTIDIPDCHTSYNMAPCLLAAGFFAFLILVIALTVYFVATADQRHARKMAKIQDKIANTVKNGAPR